MSPLKERQGQLDAWKGDTQTIFRHAKRKKILGTLISLVVVDLVNCNIYNYILHLIYMIISYIH